MLHTREASVKKHHTVPWVLESPSFWTLHKSPIKRTETQHLSLPYLFVRLKSIWFLAKLKYLIENDSVTPHIARSRILMEVQCLEQNNVNTLGANSCISYSWSSPWCEWMLKQEPKGSTCFKYSWTTFSPSNDFTNVSNYVLTLGFIRVQRLVCWEF